MAPMRAYTRSVSNALLILLVIAVVYVFTADKYKGMGETSYLRIPMFETSPTTTETEYRVETSTFVQVSVVTVTSEPIATGLPALDSKQNTILQLLKQKISVDLLSSYSDSDTKTNYYGAVSQVLNQELAKPDIAGPFKDISQDVLRHHIISELLKDTIGNTDPRAGAHTKDRLSFYKHVLEDIIAKNKPYSSGLTKTELGQPLNGKAYKDTDRPRFTHTFLSMNRVVISDETFDDLQFHHRNVVKQLREMPLPPKKLFQGNGIVILTSKKFLPGALVTIGQLREMGSKLPVEVILNYEEDYDTEMCEVMLPKLNAKCLIIERELTSELLKSLKLKKFQLKIVGVLVSRFDNIIMLDADNIPIKNVDKLLESEAFNATKFLLWPDMWHRGTSPIFYELIDRQIGEVIHREGLRNGESWEEYLKKDKFDGVAFNDLEGTFPGQLVETGQMVFSKVQHFRSFVLALYYNVYGDSHYYGLLFQGSFGDGDRETFLPALEIMNEPYFLSTYDVWLAGFEGEDGRPQETTIVQYDIDQTYHYDLKWKQWLKKKKLDTRMPIFQDNDYTTSLRSEFLKDHEKEKLQSPEVMFLHMHRPKVNPVINADPSDPDNYHAYEKRNLGKVGKYKELKGRDWELKVHSISQWVACEFLTESYWQKSTITKKEVCDGVSKFVQFLKRDSTRPGDAQLTVLPNRVSEYKLLEEL